MRRVRLLRGPAAEGALRVIAGDRHEAIVDAAAIRRAATEDRERILEEARQDAQRIRGDAMAEGRERGVAAVTELLVAARAAAARARDEGVADLRGLAVKIAEKLLGHALAVDPALVVDLTLEALRHAGEPQAMRVRCHPDDLALLESGRPRLLDRCRSAAVLRLEPDDRIARGGCAIESELGSVDARLATQLDAIERALRGEPT